MLKLPKGLKKKKKDKKSKKNQELFTEEELEQFKREQKARQLAEEAEKQKEQEQQSKSSGSKPKTDDDEWSKFNQLTTGIDTVLKKTQGDLDRIKESSFFQRVTPKKIDAKKTDLVKSTKQDNEEQQDEAAAQKEAVQTFTEEELEQQRSLACLKDAVIELSESEEESEEADDIFDTNYIDELTSGNVQLAYVSESPDEVDLGPDPFDTAYADKIIKGPEVSKRGKKIVNIGSAVQVLTGRVEKVASNTGALKRPRRGPQNLLLESFDKDQDCEAADLEGKTAVSEKPVLSLLDDFADDINDAPIDLSGSLHLQYLKQKEEEEKEAERQRQEALKLKEFEKDEFDDLAAESLTKKEEVIVVDQTSIAIAPVLEEATNWSAFETTSEEKENLVENDLDDFEDPEVDPFDTDFVETVIREKSADDDDFDFDPRADEPKVELKSSEPIVIQPSLSVQQKDLLSGSTTDLSDLDHIPVITTSESIEREIDPFDTSAVISIVQPKETEIRFLEKELLSDSGLKHSLSDPDFDPRSDEKTNIPIAIISSTAERKSSLSLNITSHKSVAFAGNLSAQSDSKIHKPLTPYYSANPIEDSTEASDLSDSDFNPRAITPTNIIKADLLGVNEAHNIKVLTPSTDSNTGGDDIYINDPFDTSNVSGALLPGKAELKLIENELIESARTPQTDVLDINSDSQELGLGAKVLTPQITLPIDESFEEADPFDTSFASNIAPGQAEIKVIESELIHK